MSMVSCVQLDDPLTTISNEYMKYRRYRFSTNSETDYSELLDYSCHPRYYIHNDVYIINTPSSTTMMYIVSIHHHQPQ